MSQDQGFRVPPPPVAKPPAMNGQGGGLPQAAPPAVAQPPTVVREASAPRRWTPKGVALAVILIVLGGLVVMVGLQNFAQRDTVLVVAKAVPVGTRITGADVTTAEITTDPALKPISSSDRDQVVGKVAMVDLRAGTLFTRAELGTSDGFTSGQVLVPLPLKQGQFPARGLSPGQSVTVVATPGGQGASSNSATTAPSSTTGTRATVAEVGATDTSSGVTVVDVRVPADASVALAQLAATGNVTVLLLPPGR